MIASTLQRTVEARREEFLFWLPALPCALLLVGVFLFVYPSATGRLWIAQAAGNGSDQAAPAEPRRSISNIAADGNPATGTRTAPSFSLKTISGKNVTLSDYQGRIVVLNFWATWCGPCRMETPWLVELRRKYQARGVEIIGVTVEALDPDYDAQDIHAFIKEHKVNYPIVLATREVIEAYGPISGIPATIVIDRAGQIQARHRGLITFENLESKIKRLL